MPRKTAAATPAEKQPLTKATEAVAGAIAEEDMLARHVKADAASLDLRLETMAHALVYDIDSLHDVIARLYNLVDNDHRPEVVKKFFAYYVPRLEVLLEEDYLLGNITALSDLGEWRLHDAKSHGDYAHYPLILEMMKKPLTPSPQQMAMLLERSALVERENPSRGESWIPKTSRRASTK